MTHGRDTVVLLVDDEPSLLAFVATGLEQRGFRVLRAQTAADALEKAKQLGRIDVLATDLFLPEHHPQRPQMHGLELMRRMVTLHPGIKVLLFSGQSDDMIKKLGGIPAGAAFLRKPFDLEAVAERIIQLLSTTLGTTAGGS